MGFKEAMLPMIFFVISIIGISLTAITVKTYLETNKEKDTNFNFSATILAISCLGVLVSGFFIYRGIKGPSGANAGATAATEMAGSQTNLGSQQLGLANQLKNIAANAHARANTAEEGRKLATSLGATLGQLKKNA